MCEGKRSPKKEHTGLQLDRVRGNVLYKWCCTLFHIFPNILNPLWMSVRRKVIFPEYLAPKQVVMDRKDHKARPAVKVNLNICNRTLNDSSPLSVCLQFTPAFLFLSSSAFSHTVLVMFDSVKNIPGNQEYVFQHLSCAKSPQFWTFLSSQEPKPLFCSLNSENTTPLSFIMQCHTDLFYSVVSAHFVYTGSYRWLHFWVRSGGPSPEDQGVYLSVDGRPAGVWEDLLC